jgi:site-specific recombinase
MRKQASCKLALGFVHETALVDAAVIRFVMLQSEVRDVIAQAEQEMVIAIVMRAEKLVRLFDQILVVVPDFLRRGKGGGTVGGNVHLDERLVGKLDDLEEFAGDYR